MIDGMAEDFCFKGHELTYYIETFPVGPLSCNCTIIGNKVDKSALIIDPGGDANKILNVLNREGFENISVIHTHAHFDHFLASGDIKAKTGADLGLHKDDKVLWDHLEDQCRMFGMPYKPVPAPNVWLEHGQDLYIGKQKAGCALHTPGHSPGSMSFQFDALKVLVAGDTLFQGGIGRTDLWGGDFSKIEHSITNIIFNLDESYKVVTGHGPSTTIGSEIRTNPYVKL